MRAPLGNTLGAPEVPRRLSSITRAPCLRGSASWPAFAGGTVGGECNLVVLNAGEAPDNAHAVGSTHVDAGSLGGLYTTRRR